MIDIRADYLVTPPKCSWHLRWIAVIDNALVHKDLSHDLATESFARGTEFDRSTFHAE